MSRSFVRFGSPVFLCGLVFLLWSCVGKPAAGGKCTKAGAMVCTDPANALYCSAGTYQAISCRGPKGCAGSMGSVSCDDDLANVGDGCVNSTNANYSCGTDHKSEVVCKDGKFTLNRACKGPGGCSIKNDTIDCDNTIADVGDPCTTGSYGCSTDHGMLLHCVSDKFVNDNSCRGPKQCVIKVEGTKKVANCDDSVANEGDPCDELNEPTCSTDTKSELQCKGYKFTKTADCKRKDGCFRGSEGPPRCQF